MNHEKYNMKRSKSLIILLVIQLIAINTGFTQEKTVTPCQRATYDAKHGILRSEEMLGLIFESQEEILEYVKCYHMLTGILIKVEPETKAGLEDMPTYQKVIIGAIVSLILVGILVQVVDFDLGPTQRSYGGEPIDIGPL